MPVVHTIDLKFQGVPNVIASFLVECGDALALIETGPGSTLPTLLQGIRDLGFDPTIIRHVFVTHVHLDHAGAAGWWAQQGATVYSHPRAVPHLKDPSKLIGSAKQIYGDLMDKLWGEMLPVPENRLIALSDGEQVTVGRGVFTAYDTPGHARHHHVFVIEDICFTGDVAGVRMPKSRYLSVAAAPPQFDPVAYVQSIDRLEKENFKTLYLAHFGRVDDVQWHWQIYRKRVIDAYETVRGFLNEGLSGEALHQAYTDYERSVAMEAGVSAEQWKLDQLANHTRMCADGIALYCTKNP